MVVATASTLVDMNPAVGNGTYLVPTLSAMATATRTSTQIDVQNRQNRRQQYFGSFDLPAVALGVYSTSTFTGFKQYSSASALPDSLSYEVTGASLNGQEIINAINAGDPTGLFTTLFNGNDQILGSQSIAFNDTLLGFAGNDVILGGAGLDSISGGTGHDTINGGPGDDHVAGGFDDDIVRGGQDNDRLLGETGRDVLNGNLGHDTLYGGLGADVFVVSKGLDVIADFSADEGDRLAVVAASLPAGGLAAALRDSADGLVLTRDGFGTTTLSGWTVATFDLRDVNLV